jgi:cell division inhibitor SepF
MSVWKRAMEYLGLGPEDAYDDYDEPIEPERPARPRPVRDDSGRMPRGYPDHEIDPPVRPVGRPTVVGREPDVVVRRPAPPTDDSSVQPRPINPRPIQPSRGSAGGPGEPYTVRPQQFAAAQDIADRFKEGVPVLMNLDRAEPELRRRLIDFASGVCYAVNGKMEQVAKGVYLLKPAGRSGHEVPEYGD